MGTKVQEEGRNRSSPIKRDRFQPVKGMRDFWPAEMLKREFVLSVMKEVAQRWGFLPMETPALESFELLAAKGGGGEAIKKEIYYFKDQGNRELGLRFDLTVPTARLLASKLDLPLPFKRYATGDVWRYDNPQAFRWREFRQFDLDIFGSDKPEADAEIISITCSCFDALGFKDFTIRLNSRKIVEGYIGSLGIRDISEVFRSIDKLDKIGEDGVQRELSGKLANRDDVKKILDLIKIKGKPEDVFKQSKEILTNKLAKDGLEEVEKIFNKIKVFGFDKSVIIDFGLVRGLDYYTGSVFEVAVSGGKMSLGGGGRYDKIIEQFGGKPTPAVGIGLGFERIVEIMIDNKMISVEAPIKLFVVSVSESTRNKSIEICQKLRREGIASDSDISGKNFSAQLKLANTKGIPWVIIVGENELKENKVKLKDMVCGKEKLVKIEEIIKEFKKIGQ